MKDPKAALEARLGAPVPDGIDVNVLRQNERRLYVVLPHVPSDDTDLDERQLEAVSGGWGPNWVDLFEKVVGSS